MDLKNFIEKDLYLWLKKNRYNDLSLYDDKLSYTDCYSKKNKTEIELKCRKKDYDGLLIEKIKYDNLIYRAIHTNRKPIYVCSTPKGVYLWNLFVSIPSTFSEFEGLPFSTYFENNDLVSKNVGFLFKTDAIKLIEIKNE